MTVAYRLTRLSKPSAAKVLSATTTSCRAGNQRAVNAARDFLKSAEVNFPTLGIGRSALQ